MLNWAYNRGRFRSSVEKLRKYQLRDSSLYINLRVFVPVPVLCAIWLGVVHQSFVYPLQRILTRSVTIHHLLTACGIAVLWNIWLGFVTSSRHSAKGDLLAEVFRLISASFACGLLPLMLRLDGGVLGLGVLCAGLTILGLLAASFFLLGSFLIGAVLSSHLIRARIALVVGSSQRLPSLQELLQNHYARFHVLGCVDDEYHSADSNSDLYLGPIDVLPDLLKAHPVEVVLIALPMRSNYDDIQKVIRICKLVGVETHYVLDLFEMSGAQVEFHSRGRFTVLSTLGRNPKQYLKRIIDLLLALLFLVLFSPVLLAAALAVRISSPGPVLFVQQRYGMNRKRFPMYKFRSMVADAEQRQAALEAQNEAQGPVFKLKADPRITSVGAFLRRTSIDELPQLFNVLRGEMSIVGPRPLPLRDVSRFEESWLLRRFSVKPGLTCLWQVNGRSNSSFDFWIRQDLAYIDGWSLLLDLKILLLTIPAVLRGKGAV